MREAFCGWIGGWWTIRGRETYGHGYGMLGVEQPSHAWLHHLRSRTSYPQQMSKERGRVQGIVQRACARPTFSVRSDLKLWHDGKYVVDCTEGAKRQACPMDGF